MQWCCSACCAVFFHRGGCSHTWGFWQTSVEWPVKLCEHRTRVEGENEYIRMISAQPPSQRGSLFTFLSPAKKERSRKIYIQDGFISSSPHCTWENRSWLTGHFASVRVWKAWMNNLISLCWLWGRKNKSVCLQQRNIGCCRGEKENVRRACEVKCLTLFSS